MSVAGTMPGVLRVGWFAMAAVLLVAAGCRTESVVTSDGRPMPPDPRPAPMAPAGLQPNRMTLLSMQKAEDSDGNGYPDRIHATAALFAVPHEMAVEADGAFVLTLFRQGEAHVTDARPLGEWRFENERLYQIRTRTLYGVAYPLQISLLDHGSDRLPPIMADLRGRYEPAGGGETVYSSDEIRPVQIGRR